MILARNNNTPIPYWLSMPIMSLSRWIRTNNRIEEAIQEARKKK